MADKKEDPSRLFWMLGLALTLPMILVSGPIAGYCIGGWLIHQFHGPSYLVPLLMGLGLLGSGLQSYRLIRRLSQNQKS